LGSRDRAARLEVVFGLSGRGDHTARRLLASVSHDPDPAVRAAAVRGLVHLGDPSGLDVALSWLRDGSGTDRLAALELLRLAPALSAPTRVAVERALLDLDLQVRLAALELLEQQGPEPSRSAVSSLLDDVAPVLRARAARALGVGGGVLRAGEASFGLLLLPRLEDSDRHVVREALQAVAALGRPEAGPALLRLLESGPDELREEVVAALGAVGFSGAVAALREHAARRPSDPVAARAQRALGRIDSAEAQAALLTLLGRIQVAPELEEALISAGPQVVPELITRLGDTVSASAAARVLAQRGSREAIPALLGVLRRGGQGLAAAIEALGALQATVAVTDLVLLARDPALGVRRRVLLALADIGDARAAVVVAPALRDPSPQIRAAAVALARALRLPAHAAPLTERLRDANAGVRRMAARALEAQGGTASVLALYVRTPSGEPRGGVLLTAVTAQGAPAKSSTDASGRATLPTSAKAPLAVTARDRGGELRLERARHGLGEISGDEAMRP
jgi:HEAT repeat protein